MPGRNSLFKAEDKSLYDRYLAQQVYIFVMGTVATVEIVGMARFFFLWPDLRFSLECFLYIAYFLISDYFVFTGMLACRRADPGYLIPTGESPPQSPEQSMRSNVVGIDENDGDELVAINDEVKGPEYVSEDVLRCKKCGLTRTHERVNHCSRCNRCVDYMDHHCVFVDNCIGRRNVAFYF